MPCYVTQQTSEEINEDRQKKLNDQLNVIYFRRFHVRKGMQKGF
jgi:hypothetical protein